MKSESAAPVRRAKRRWPLALAALMMLLIVAGIAFNVFSSRTVQGAVPGSSSIVSLAATPNGFTVSSVKGLFTSNDGLEWKLEQEYLGKRNLVASGGEKAILVSDGEVFDISGTRPVTLGARLAGETVAVGASSDGRIVAATASGTITEITVGAELAFDMRGGPEEVIALDGASGSSDVFAGGISSGLWRADGPQGSWRKLLGTQVRAVLLDEERPGVIFLATSGGIIMSRNLGRSWRFTTMRMPVASLAQSTAGTYALAKDRMVYELDRRTSEWRSLASLQDPSS